MGTRLNPVVVEAIRDAGLTKAAYVRRTWPDGEWRGDVCGCTDDRCVGHHHDANEDCLCFPVILDQALDDVRAAKAARS